MNPRRRLWVALAAVAILAAGLVSGTWTSADDGWPDRAGLIEMVQKRDDLIQEQESLLNTYRCLFDIDTEVVPSGCGPTEPPPAAFPNDHVLGRWESEGLACKWTAVQIETGRTVWNLDMLVTITADEPRPWERWASMDVQWRAMIGEEVVVETDHYEYPLSSRDDWERDGRTLEIAQTSFPVYLHASTDSMAEILQAERTGEPVPMHWYAFIGGGEPVGGVGGFLNHWIPLDGEPDLGAVSCHLTYDSLLTWEQRSARSLSLTECLDREGSSERDRCFEEVRSDGRYLDIRRWDGSNVCGYGRC